MAKEKGFYKDIGLDVDVKEWKSGINMVDEVINGKSQYASSRPTTMVDIAKGKDIVYLAAIYQSSPLILLADKSSGITSIKDFKNKKIMSTGDLNTDTSLLSMLFSQGIRLKYFKVLEPSFDPKDLLNGKTDLMASYISNEPYTLKKLGGEPVIFNPKDYGFDFYNDILITSRKNIENNPQQVKDFTEATIKGWEYAFSNMEETIEFLYSKKYNSLKKSKEALRYEGNELKKLAYDANGKIGKLDPLRLEKIYDIYKLLGFVQKEINFSDIIFNKTFIDSKLSSKEIAYLKQKKKITMCIDPNWMPFESLDENGNYIGMSSDYFKLIEKTLSTKIEVLNSKTWSESIELAKKRECDIMSLVMRTPEREKYLNFTTPYLKIPLVIATKTDVPFINDIEDIKNQKIAIPKGYAYLELLKNKYPNLNIVEVEDIDDGLNRVRKSEVFAYIGTLASVGYKFQTKFSGELKIAGKVGEHWELGIGVRNDDPILFGIMQKAINDLTYEQKRDILNKWVSIKYEKGIDHSLVLKITLIPIIIILLIGYWNNKLVKANQKLKELNNELNKKQKEIEKMATTDNLTGLHNRHKLIETLNSEKKRADRYDHGFGIIILDIDFFKQVNDTYGHNIGDEILIEFANILKKNSRETDHIGRWGGEEFLIIIPQSDNESLMNFAHILKERIENHNFKHVGKLTASFGVALYKKSEFIKETIARADKALYRSKDEGRNKVNFQAD